MLHIILLKLATGVLPLTWKVTASGKRLYRYPATFLFFFFLRIIIIIIIIIIRLLRIKAAHNTLQYIKRSSSNKREEIKTNTTMKETNVQN